MAWMCALWAASASRRSRGPAVLEMRAENELSWGSWTAEMLVMWDRGFHDYEMFRCVLARGGQVLARLPAHVHTEKLECLADGSYLARLYPADKLRRVQGEHA